MPDPFRLFMNETVADPAEAAGGGGDTDVSAGGDPSAGGAASAGAPPPETPWSLGQDEWSQFTGTVGQLSELVNQLYAPEDDTPDEPAVLPELDPFADNFAEQLAARDEALLARATEQALGPVRPLLDDIANERGDAVRNQLLEHVKPAEFDEPTGERWRALSNAIAPGFFNPDDPRSAVSAVQQAGQMAAQIITTERQAAVDEYRRQLGGITDDNPADPGVTGGALPTEPKPTSYKDVLSRWEARNS